MPTYTVKDPMTGKTVSLEGTSPPTEQELNGIFSKLSQKPSLGNQVLGWSRMPSKTLGATLDVMKGQVKNPVAKAGLNVLGNTMPPNYTPLGVGLMAGAEAVAPMEKAVAPMVRGFGEQLESVAGSPKGTLAHGYASAKNIVGRGIEAASPLYKKAGKVVGGLLGGMYKPEEIVDTVNAALKEGKPIHPSEALKYRKALDILSKSGRYVKDELFEMRNAADSVVKQSQDYAMADPKFKEGMFNQALRGILPKNKYGSTSAFKTAIMAGVPGAGWALSPVVQGIGATGLGAGVRMAKNPALVAAINSLIKNLAKSDNQNGNANP